MKDNEPVAIQDPFEILGSEEAEVVQKARAFIQAGVPDRDNVAQQTMFITRNIQHQEAISNLLAGIRTARSRLTITMMRQESRVRPDLILEGFKAAAERDSMLHRDSKYRDIRERYLILGILEERCTDVHWMLKSLMRVME